MSKVYTLLIIAVTNEGLNMSRYKNKILFGVLTILLSINLILNKDRIEKFIIENNNQVFIICFGILVQVLISILVVYFEMFILLLLTKVYFKKTFKIKQFYFPVIVANIACVCINMVTYSAFKVNTIESLKMISLLSPVTLIKTLIIFFVVSRDLGLKNKKMIFLCLTFLIIEYALAAISFFTMLN